MDEKSIRRYIGPEDDEIGLEDYPVAMKWRLKLFMALAKVRMRLAKLFG